MKDIVSPRIPPVPGRRFDVARTRIDWSADELHDIAYAVVDMLQQQSRVNLTVSGLVPEQKSIDHKHNTFYDMKIVLFSTQDSQFREIKVSVVRPFLGKMFVYRCEDARAQNDPNIFMPMSPEPLMAKHETWQASDLPLDTI